MTDDSASTDIENDRQFERALQHFSADRGQEAARLCVSLLQSDPDYLPALQMLGVLHLQNGEPEQGIELFSRAGALAPDSASIHFNLGTAQSGQGLYADAIANLERAAALEPQNADIYINLGIAQRRNESAAAAEASFRHALSLQPASLDLHNNLGNALLDQHRYTEAINCFQSVLEQDPRHLEGTVNLGSAQYAAGATHEAMACFRQALEIDPGNKTALTGMGGILFEAQDFDAAMDYLRPVGKEISGFAYERACLMGDAFRSVTSLDRYDDIFAALPAVSGIFPDPGRPGPVIATGCDYGYFKTYATALALSAGRNAPGCDVHLHVVNPAESFDRDIAVLRQKMGQSVLTVTTEHRPNADHHYFTLIRFLRLSQLLEHSGRTVLHLDADSLINRPLSLDDTVGAACDLAIPLRLNDIAIHFKVLITSLFVRPTPRAGEFMRRFAIYLGDRIVENKLAWRIDQAAFYLTYRMMGFDGQDVSLMHLPRTLYDSDFAPESQIWAAKGDRKNNVAYERKVEELISNLA